MLTPEYATRGYRLCGPGLTEQQYNAHMIVGGYWQLKTPDYHAQDLFDWGDYACLPAGTMVRPVDRFGDYAPEGWGPCGDVRIEVTIDTSGVDAAMERMRRAIDAMPESPNQEPAEDLAVESIGYQMAQLPPDIAGTCAAMCLEKLTGVPAREVLDFVNARERQRKGEDMSPTEPGWNWARLLHGWQTRGNPGGELGNWSPVLVAFDGLGGVGYCVGNGTAPCDDGRYEWGVTIPMPSP